MLEVLEAAGKEVARGKMEYNRLLKFYETSNEVDLHPLTVCATIIDHHVLSICRRFAPEVTGYDKKTLKDDIVKAISCLALLYSMAK